MTERAKKLLLLYYKQSRKIRRVSGLPPLTFKAKKAGTLKNYRIYGNTETKTRSYSGAAPLSFPIADGTVSNYRVYGQTSRNLFDFNTAISGYRIIWTTGELNVSDDSAIISDFIPVKENNYQINISAFVACYNSEKIYLGIYSSKGYIKNYSSAVKSFTIDNNCKYIKIFTFSNSNTPVSLSQDTMLNSGSALLPYEPYGESVGNLVTDSQSEHYGEYAIPITNNSETENIYLDELLTKSGDNADYIDYAEQKRYNADGTSGDVTLPALPAQSSTNSLSVGTSVQPSSVAVDVAEVVSCGDRTENLFDKDEYLIGGTQNPTINTNYRHVIINLKPNTLYTFSSNVPRAAGYNHLYIYDDDWIQLQGSFYKDKPITVLSNSSGTINFEYAKRSYYNDLLSGKYYIMLNAGSTAQSYEPYGKYKIPVTLTADSAETTDIYLDEPLAKSGNNADYIDYATQKRHNSDGTESSVTLPEISTLAGTNTLTVGTEVQPSSVEIKGRIKAAGGD